MKMIRNIGFAAAALAILAMGLLSGQDAKAAATTQTTHAFLCAPHNPVGADSRRIVNPSTGGGSYNLNGQGCALIAGADIGWFLTQGFTYGQGIFALRQEAITASTTSSTSTITLPAYGYILGVVLSETSGQAITGGIDIGDSGSATRFASAIALTSNNTVAVPDVSLTHVFANSGVPAPDQILVACHTSCNSGAVNITILFSYF